MPNITDKIKRIIIDKNINKTALSKKIGMSRDSVYNLSDETIKLSTLIKLCDVLKLQIVDFFTEGDKKGSSQVVQEPLSQYGNQSEVIKVLKNTIKLQEKAIEAMEITIGLLQKEAAPKMKYEKKQMK